MIKIDSAKAQPIKPIPPDPRKTAKMPMADFRIALYQGGYLEQVEAYMDGPAATKEQQILWEYSTEVARTDPTLEALALALDFTNEDLDKVFGLI